MSVCTCLASMPQLLMILTGRGKCETLSNPSHGHWRILHHPSCHLQLTERAGALLFKGLWRTLHQSHDAVPDTGETTDWSLTQDKGHVGDITRFHHIHTATWGRPVWGSVRGALERNDVCRRENAQSRDHAATEFPPGGQHYEEVASSKVGTVVCSVYTGRAFADHHRVNAARKHVGISTR